MGQNDFVGRHQRRPGCITARGLCDGSATNWGSNFRRLNHHSENPSVPRLVRFSGLLKDASGVVPSGDVPVTFTLYEQPDGGTPLWSETQTVQPNKDGRYSVLLGVTKADGLPRDLFTSNRAQWVAVQPGLAGVSEQPRVLLVGVPYAIKAVDAETPGGLPASAFQLAIPVANSSAAGSTISPTGSTTTAPAAAVTGTGTTDFIPLWTNSSMLANSAVFQTGSGNSAKVGIGTTSPATTLDVKGGSTLRGTVSLPSNGAASAMAGKNSQPLSLAASAFNSTSKTAKSETFVWQAEAAGNNTANPSGTLNLLFGANGGSAIETGLSIASNGQIAFAPGQTFPTGEVVTSLNSLTGKVTLAAGTNVTITPSGSTLTIASTPSTTITHDATLTGLGTSASPLGVTNPMALSGNNINPIIQGSNTFGDGVVGNSSQGDGVNGVSLASNKSGVYGANEANGGFGVFGRNTFDGSTGSLGSVGFGVSGFANSNNNGTAGVYGQSLKPSNLGAFDAVGVWGDSFNGNGVLGTSNQQVGVVGLTLDSINQFNAAGFFDNSNANPGDPAIQTFGENVGGSCTIDNAGNLTCTGVKSAVVPVDNGARKVALYAIESPQNWFEDFGSGRLANGSATIRLEGVFAQTVNTGVNYHVYLTPNGDCKGLYVTQKTATSFEVRELGQGTSRIAFDYRIVAERKGYEQIRLEDKTPQFDPQRLATVVKRLKQQAAK